MKVTKVLSSMLCSVALFSLVPSFQVQAATDSYSQGVVNQTVIPPAGSINYAEQIGMVAEAVGRSQFANLYGGIALDDQANHVNVYLTKLDPVAERAIQGSAPANLFTFILTSHTEQQSLETHQKVINEATRIQSNGIQLVSWGPDVKTGKEQLEVRDLTPSITAYLTSLFGSENIEIQETTDTITNFDNRSSDSAPWNGGDFITDGSEDCSSGFPVYAGSSNYLLTDSHCYSVGEYIDNGAANLNIGSFALMGTVSNTDTSSGGLDAELINTTSYGGSYHMIWTGSSSSPADSAVSGTLSATVGSQVCQSGAYDGETCGLTVQFVNHCVVNGNGRNICSVDEATGSSGTVAAGGGDSGGPVFRFSGSNLEATGIVQGGSSTFSCPTNNPDGTRLCSSTIYYTEIGPILSKYGVQIKTN